MTIEETIRNEAKEIIESAMKEIDSEESYMDNSGNTIKSVFIGTCFNIMPSGKYYMPFACSNVKMCPKCKGKGEITNPNANSALYKEYRYKEQKWIEFMRNNDTWYHLLTDDQQKQIDEIRIMKEYYVEKIECPTCHGIGSEEVYKDRVMQKALEKYAEKYGAFVHSGEGDPCDMFVSIVVDEDMVMEE